MQMKVPDEVLERLMSIRVKKGRDDDWITVDRRDGDAGTKWAVCKRGLVLNQSGEWEYEPMPSSRDDKFLARCRFNSFDAAYTAAMLEQQSEGK